MQKDTRGDFITKSLTGLNITLGTSMLQVTAARLPVDRVILPLATTGSLEEMRRRQLSMPAT